MEEFNQEEKQEMFNPEEPDDEEIYPPRKFSRSASNSIIGGVCGGVGEYLRFEPNLLRVLFVLSTLLGGWGILIYTGAVLLMPVKPRYDEFTEEEIIMIENSDSKTVIGSVMIMTGLYFILLPMGLLQLLGLNYVSPILFLAVLMFTTGIKLINSDSALRSSIQEKEFFKSRSDKRFMGVCGGIAKYVNIDPTIIRVLGVISLFITAGITILIYLFIASITTYEAEVIIDEN